MGWNFNLCIKPLHKFLEINPRDEAARSFLTIRCLQGLRAEQTQSKGMVINPFCKYR